MTAARRLLPVLLALVLASCGGDDKSSKTTAPSQPASTTPKSAAKNPAISSEKRAVDQARAKRAVFRLSDFPPGWRTDDSKDESTTECTTVKDLAQTAKADGDFVKEDVKVGSVVRVFATTPDAKEAFSRYTSVETRSCLRRDFPKELEDSDQVKSGELTLGTVSVGELSAPRYGEESGAVQVVIPLGQKEPIEYSVEFLLDAIFVRQDRAVLVGLFLAQESSDSDLQGTLLKAATARLEP